MSTSLLEVLLDRSVCFASQHVSCQHPLMEDRSQTAILLLRPLLVVVTASQARLVKSRCRSGVLDQPDTDQQTSLVSNPLASSGESAVE